MMTCGPTAFGSGTSSEWTRSKPTVTSISERGVEDVVPGEPGVVRFRVGVGILAGDKLESHRPFDWCNVCCSEDSVMRPEVLIQADVGRIGIDGLRRVGVECPRVNVGAVGRRLRVSGDPSLDQPVHRGVGGQWACAPIGQRHQDVAVHAAAQFLLRAIQRQVSAPPQTEAGIEAVVVFVGGLNTAHLEERPRGEDAVGVTRTKCAAVEIPRTPAE